jgi:argininosuccinate lyase
VAVDVRLHIKDQRNGLGCELAELAEQLVRFGKRHDRVPMVGRTHLQPAMPSSVGLWATGHAEMILDQAEVFESAYRLNDLCPLGSAAGYGVPLPLDRARTSSLLGFARPIHNVFGASMARGENEAALISASAQLMSVLSRLAEDMIVFSMPEFGYFTLPREYCTGSSIMPQKYNPDVLELVRGKTAQVIGWQTAALTILHAMPGGYNRDLQDCKLLYMKSLETVRTTLRIMAKMVAGMGINADRLRAGFIPGVFATDVALRMVAEGTPWREAYHEVRDHLERLEREDPDAAVAAKTHEGTTGGIDHAFYRSRVSELRRLNRKRQQEFARRFKALLG